MNTKIIMTSSALVLGITGIAMTFAPDQITAALRAETSTITLLFVQIIGGLYFGFAMLNWMVKNSLIGGIYNRPIATANFTHFTIVGIAIWKILPDGGLPISLLVTGVVYAVLGIAFGLILFTHPLKKEQVPA